MPEAKDPLTPEMRQTSQGAIRLFFIDEKSRDPVVGLVVNIFLDSPRTAEPQRQPASSGNELHLLARLQSGEDGYVSAKFDFSNVAANSRLAVRHEGGSGNALVLNVDDLLAGNDTHSIQIDASDPNVIKPHLGLPSILSPDAKDLKVSPGSIGLIPQLRQRGGLCSQLMPTMMGVRRFE